LAFWFNEFSSQFPPTVIVNANGAANPVFEEIHRFCKRTNSGGGAQGSFVRQRIDGLSHSRQRVGERHKYKKRPSLFRRLGLSIEIRQLTRPTGESL
jgi:hypothetical protein